MSAAGGSGSGRRRLGRSPAGSAPGNGGGGVGWRCARRVPSAQDGASGEQGKKAHGSEGCAAGEGREGAGPRRQQAVTAAGAALRAGRACSRCSRAGCRRPFASCLSAPKRSPKGGKGTAQVAGLWEQTVMETLVLSVLKESPLKGQWFK